MKLHRIHPELTFAQLHARAYGKRRAIRAARIAVEISAYLSTHRSYPRMVPAYVDRSETCRHCGRAFLRRREGQEYCVRPECRKAERRAARKVMA